MTGSEYKPGYPPGWTPTGDRCYTIQPRVAKPETQQEATVRVQHEEFNERFSARFTYLGVCLKQRIRHLRGQ